MLKIESVYHSYDNSFQLENISIELKTGEILGIIGESGCGKTTLLKLIFGKLDADKGKLQWKNSKILGPSHQLIAGQEDFKYVTQDFELMPYISVLENVVKPLSRQHIEENKEKAKALLKIVNLEAQQHKKVKYLSGGQKQRVALAQALAKTPKLLLLDEPFSHIDSFFKNELRRDLFSFIKKEKITCILATHDNEDVLPFADKIMVLKNGATLAINTPEQLYNNPDKPYIAGLFGDYNLVDSKLISERLKNEEVIVYPNEIELIPSEKSTVDLQFQYFMGEYYKTILKCKDKVFIVHTPYHVDFSKQYNVGFKTENILNRLH